jgi:hypothetical protein
MNERLTQRLTNLRHRICHDWFGEHRSNGQVVVGFDDYHGLCSSSKCPECGQEVMLDHHDRWVPKYPKRTP